MREARSRGCWPRATRRSRFSDKLVDLATARFTQHDYERWGRLWWSRLAEFVARPGDRRADLEPLLTGRPSDLAKEASRVPAPPVPDEVSRVSRGDYRIVYFAGYSPRDRARARERGPLPDRAGRTRALSRAALARYAGGYGARVAMR